MTQRSTPEGASHTGSAAQSTVDGTGGVRHARRAHVKVDRYAPMQLRREHALSAVELMLLLGLAFLADYRTHVWCGTLQDLSDDLGLDRRAVTSRPERSRPGALDRLVAEGLVEFVEPFGRGQGVRGSLRVTAYELLVTDARPADRLEVDERKPTAERPMIDRSSTDDRPNGWKSPVATSTSSTPRGREAVREGGSARELRDNGAAASQEIEAIALIRRELAAEISSVRKRPPHLEARRRRQEARA